MTKSVGGKIRDGKVEIDPAVAPADGTSVLVTFEAPKAVVTPRLLERGKYRKGSDLSSADFSEYRRQMRTEWEDEIDEFFPPRD